MPPLLFLSHAGVDTDRALALAEAIEGSPAAQQAGLEVWVDHRANGPHRLLPGTPWQDQLEDAIAKHSTAFAVLVTKQGVGNWVQLEVCAGINRVIDDRKKGRVYPFVPILADDDIDVAALPVFARQYQGVRLGTDGRGLSDLVSVVADLDEGRSVALVAEPFKGLEAFEAEDAALFFGRKKETAELVERLRATNFVMVLGDSGSGKSSLVKAGLVPAFRDGAFADPLAPRPPATRWHVVEMRPGGAPFDALADGVSRAAQAAGRSLEDCGTLKEWARAEETPKFRDALVESGPTDAMPCVLLVIDQFEELWTLAEDEERQRFLTTLLGVVQPGDPTIRVVVTMRRDYFPLATDDEQLKQRLALDKVAVRFVLGVMTDAGLREAVEKPLLLAGVAPAQAAALADEVIKDVAGQPGNLALLEMALHETWARRHESGGDLSLAYERIDGLEGALAKAAEDVFSNPKGEPEKLGAEERPLAEALFMRLVRAGDAGGATRRLLLLDELDEASRAVARKLSTRACRRLLVVRSASNSDVGGESARNYVELAHEQLVTQWPTYRHWLSGRTTSGMPADSRRAGDKRALDRLMDAAARWRESGELNDDLARGSELVDDLHLLDARPTWLSSWEKRFVERSVAERDRAIDSRRTWLQVGGALGAILIAILSVLTITNIRQRRATEDALAIAERNLETSRRATAAAVWNDLPREHDARPLGPRERNALWTLAVNRGAIGEPFVAQLGDSDRLTRFGAAAAPIGRALGPSFPKREMVPELVTRLLHPIARPEAAEENDAFANGLVVMLPNIPDGDRPRMVRLLLDPAFSWRAFGVAGTDNLAELVAKFVAHGGGREVPRALKRTLARFDDCRSVKCRSALARAVAQLVPKWTWPSQGHFIVSRIVDALSKDMDANARSTLAKIAASSSLGSTPIDALDRVLSKLDDAPFRPSLVAAAAQLASMVGQPEAVAQIAEPALRVMEGPASATERRRAAGRLMALAEALPIGASGRVARAVLTIEPGMRDQGLVSAGARALAPFAGRMNGRDGAAVSAAAKLVIGRVLRSQLDCDIADADMGRIVSLLGPLDRQSVEDDLIHPEAGFTAGWSWCACPMVAHVLASGPAPDEATIEKFREFCSAALRYAPRPFGDQWLAMAAKTLAPQLTGSQARAVFGDLLDTVDEFPVEEVVTSALQALGRDMDDAVGGLSGIRRAFRKTGDRRLVAVAEQLAQRVPERIAAQQLDDAFREVEADDSRLAVPAAVIKVLVARTGVSEAQRDALRRALAWAPSDEDAEILAQAYVAAIKEDDQRLAAAAEALSFPLVAGNATQVLADAVSNDLGVAKGATYWEFIDALHAIRPALASRAVECPPPLPEWPHLECPTI